MKKDLYTWIINQQIADKRMLAVLIDPDKADSKHLSNLLSPQNLPYIDLLLVGGSLLTKGDMDTTLTNIQNLCDLPTVIFPGDPDQICSKADAILLLSLISGRNPDLLIGKHVTSAIKLKRSELEVISTGYMLIDGGVETTASYVTGTSPLPADKPGIAAMTALAGEQLGKQIIYMDAGSGAQQPISSEMISEVRRQIEIPIIVGGGIRNKAGIVNAWNAGANVVVIGNVLEKNPSFLPELYNGVLHG
jgi:phosphoglycerol geranylgeranyltransferase